MKRFWILPLLCFMACSGILFAQSTGPKMSIDELVFDAGELYATVGKIEHNFVIKNTGASNLQIFKAAPS